MCAVITFARVCRLLACSLHYLICFVFHRTARGVRHIFSGTQHSHLTYASQHWIPTLHADTSCAHQPDFFRNTRPIALQTRLVSQHALGRLSAVRCLTTQYRTVHARFPAGLRSFCIFRLCFFCFGVQASKLLPLYKEEKSQKREKERRKNNKI